MYFVMEVEAKYIICLKMLFIGIELYELVWTMYTVFIGPKND